jgi:hypothetical protein
MSTCAHCEIVRVHIALFFQCTKEFFAQKNYRNTNEKQAKSID